MKQKEDDTLNERQRLNMQFIEDRLELLNTIREMIDIEFERRGMPSGCNPHPENPPPKAQGRDPTGDPIGEKALSLWQRIARLFKRAAP